MWLYSFTDNILIHFNPNYLHLQHHVKMEDSETRAVAKVYVTICVVTAKMDVEKEEGRRSTGGIHK